MIVPRTVAIPGGSFRLGAVPKDKYANTTELPRRQVDVSPFAMGIHPVTNREWAAFALTPPNDPDLPVTGVSWLDVAEFAAWLSMQTGDRWRLPTEIEWEYACRAGSETIFSCGDALDSSQANFLFDESIIRVGAGGPLPVGSYPPNPWGLYELHGNVSEWTASQWKRNHLALEPAIAGFRTIRGGSWDALPRLLRSSWRDGAAETTRRDNLGFRLVRG